MSNDSNTVFNINTLCFRAQAGDRDAETELLQHLTVSFRLFAQQRIWNQQDAEEIVQDTLVTIVAKFKDIEFETSFAAWAYKVLNNKLLDNMKKKGTHKRLIEQMSYHNESTRSESSDPELTRRLLDCFRNMSKTNNRHARILNLHYQGHTTREICDKLRLTENHFYVLLSRARVALEACLEKGNHE